MYIKRRSARLNASKLAFKFVKNTNANANSPLESNLKKLVAKKANKPKKTKKSSAPKSLNQKITTNKDQTQAAQSTQPTDHQSSSSSSSSSRTTKKLKKSPVSTNNNNNKKPLSPPQTTTTTNRRTRRFNNVNNKSTSKKTPVDVSPSSSASQLTSVPLTSTSTSATSASETSTNNHLIDIVSSSIPTQSVPPTTSTSTSTSTESNNNSTQTEQPTNQNQTAPLNESTIQSLKSQLKKARIKFDKACHQLTILDQHMSDLQNSYSNSLENDRKTFKILYRMQLATYEGTHNAYIEYIERQVEKIKKLKRVLFYDVSGGSDAASGLTNTSDHGDNLLNEPITDNL